MLEARQNLLHVDSPCHKALRCAGSLGSRLAGWVTAHLAELRGGLGLFTEMKDLGTEGVVR